MGETRVQSLGRKIPRKRAWQPTPVFLPGESPWTEEPGGLQSMGSQRVGHDWATRHTQCEIGPLSDKTLLWCYTPLGANLSHRPLTSKEKRTNFYWVYPACHVFGASKSRVVFLYTPTSSLAFTLVPPSIVPVSSTLKYKKGRQKTKSTAWRKSKTTHKNPRPRFRDLVLTASNHLLQRPKSLCPTRNSP